MLRVLIPSDAEFKKHEAFVQDLYIKSQEKICDPNSFSFIRDNTFFYLFLFNDTPFGAVYYFIDDGKLFLNGFSIRKNYLQNVNALLLSTTWFSCDIYAEAQNRASAFCLLRCGFKRVEGNLFCLKR